MSTIRAVPVRLLPAATAGAVLREFFLLCLGAAVARVPFAPMPAMFGLCLISSMCIQGVSCYGLCAGAVIGFCSVNQTDIWPLALSFPALVFAWQASDFLGFKKTKSSAVLLLGFCLVVPSLIVMPATLSSLLTWGLCCALGFCCALLLSDIKSSLSLLGHFGLNAASSVLSPVLISALVITGLCGVRFFWVAASGIAASFIVLCAAQLFGAGGGAIAGLICGGALLWGGYPAALPAILGFAGLSAGLMPLRRKFLCAAALCICAVV